MLTLSFQTACFIEFLYAFFFTSKVGHDILSNNNWDK